VFAFLKLCGVPFEHHHIFDARTAPRGQLPYVTDGETVIGDSDAILAHVTRGRGLTLDAGLTDSQRSLDHMVRRTLDNLYWVMSYSRWHDPAFWPLFSAALLATHPQLTPADLEAARLYNEKRYYYQGIGRYTPDGAYARGLGDLEVLARLLGEQPFLFGDAARSVDAGAYGFLANIHFYAIETPLKAFVQARPQLAAYCERLHRLVAG
jgi:glutathione S-transferase